MGPVWEANHVWLIFVLVDLLDRLPDGVRVDHVDARRAALHRGRRDHPARHGLRAARRHEEGVGEQREVDLVFALSSIIVPFAFGAAIGGIASGRVPVGNAEGDSFSSWLNPTSVLVGVLAVAVAAYLAAVFLAADAKRTGRGRAGRAAFRVRALVDGCRRRCHRDGAACSSSGTMRARSGTGSRAARASAQSSCRRSPALRRCCSCGCGRYGPARVTAAVAVAAVLVGWVLAQRPDVLPGLSIHEAAAGRSTLVALVIATAIGAVLLIPSLVILYGLLLGGRFDAAAEDERAAAATAEAPSRSRLLPVAGGLFAVGTLLTVFFDAPITLSLGLLCLFGFAVCGFLVLSEPVEADRS